MTFQVNRLLLPKFQTKQWRFVVLSLYRQILKQHAQKLPYHQRYLGDSYVKQEFRLSKTATEEQSVEFVTQWKEYAKLLLETPSFENLGQELDTEIVKELNEEQKAQLDRLKEEADVFKQRIMENDQTNAPKSRLD